MSNPQPRVYNQNKEENLEEHVRFLKLNKVKKTFNVVKNVSKSNYLDSQRRYT